MLFQHVLKLTNVAPSAESRYCTGLPQQSVILLTAAEHLVRFQHITQNKWVLHWISLRRSRNIFTVEEAVGAAEKALPPVSLMCGQCRGRGLS